MNREHLDRLSRAVLYEGYILYPYRPSVKNRQRWTFGSLYPPTYEEVRRGAESSRMQVECLMQGDAPELSVMLRFLHLQDRTLGRFVAGRFESMRSLRHEGQLHQSWQEAVECEQEWAGIRLEKPVHLEFGFAAQRSEQALGETGLIIREQRQLAIQMALSAKRLEPGLSRLHVCIDNTTPLADPGDREEATLRTLAAAHLILHVSGGEFVSHQDPPAHLRSAVAGCANVGAWPCLVGNPGDFDTMLAAPIILPDHAQIAPESPGDLFDGTEIDEILTLRILTLTDEEKEAVVSVDERARALLDRTEGLSGESLLGMHGRLRPARESRHE